MKIMILGADGMIGHKLYQSLSSRDYRIIITSKKSQNKLPYIFHNSEGLQLDILSDSIETVLNNFSPNYIINCIGITTRRMKNHKVSHVKYVNSKFPHILSNWAEKNNSKLIHFSTDCVFSGKKGSYDELSKTDADDLYGKSKAKGEILNNSSSLTIRASMIGREIYNFTELLEWVLSNNNSQIYGYTNAIYSGVTTLWMGELINELIQKNYNLSGIYNISSTPISKYELICKIKDNFNLKIKIQKNSEYYSNKSLISDKFFKKTKIPRPSWDSMLKNLVVNNNENLDLYKKY
jgi:dTDP-4-dehydrorhamnose reductase